MEAGATGKDIFNALITLSKFFPCDIINTMEQNIGPLKSSPVSIPVSFSIVLFSHAYLRFIESPDCLCTQAATMRLHHHPPRRTGPPHDHVILRFILRHARHDHELHPQLHLQPQPPTAQLHPGLMLRMPLQGTGLTGRPAGLQGSRAEDRPGGR